MHGKCFAVLHTGELELHRVVEVPALHRVSFNYESEFDTFIVFLKMLRQYFDKILNIVSCRINKLIVS